jgi:hypothetical protein
MKRAPRFLLVISLVAAAALPGTSFAQLAFFGGVSWFHWDEDTSPEVTESGPLFDLGFEYFTPGDIGLILGYRGRLWFGETDYEGSTLFPPHTPVEATTDYMGFSNELQGRYRRPANAGRFSDVVFGLGYETWERQLSRIQSEDYRVLYARLGFENSSRQVRSWSFGGGIKYPFWTDEDAHLDEVGFDSNPALEPGGAVSLYAEVGYRFDPRWRLVGYYDGYRFNESDPVQVTDTVMGMGTVTIVQPASVMSVLGLRLEYRLP